MAQKRQVTGRSQRGEQSLNVLFNGKRRNTAVGKVSCEWDRGKGILCRVMGGVNGVDGTMRGEAGVAGVEGRPARKTETEVCGRDKARCGKGVEPRVRRKEVQKWPQECARHRCVQNK